VACSIARASHSLRDDAGEAEGLLAQGLPHVRVARAGGVALVEDEADDVEHRVESLRQRLVARHAERDVGRADLRLCPRQALRHRRLGDQEGMRDLGRRQPAEETEGQRDLRLPRQGRVTAGEHQSQALVRHARCHGLLPRLLRGRRRRRRQLELRRPCALHPLAPEPVDRTVARHRHDPRERVVRHAVARPALDRGREGVLDGVLGQVPVADRADERRDRPAEVLAEQAVGGACCDGRAQDAAVSPAGASARAA
jgi:hypothetical protein